MDTQAQAGGNALDLLSSIMGVTVRNEEKIAAEDRAFCEDRQAKLYATLRQLQWWYGLFTANADPYRDSRNLTYQQNGSVDKSGMRRIYHNENADDYTAFEFIPASSINEVVELYGKAVEAFTRDIVRHFNRKYNVSVPMPDIDRKTLPMDFVPTYQSYVDEVIAHLGGKGFRETAEEELIARFLDVVDPGPRGTFQGELKDNKIIFHDLLWFNSFTWDQRLQFSGDSERKLGALCAGFMFALTGSLNGGTGFIAGYNRDSVDVARWYDFNISAPLSVKFYKNRRVDFKFENVSSTGVRRSAEGWRGTTEGDNAAIAERCWKKLRLDTFKTNDNADNDGK